MHQRDSIFLFSRNSSSVDKIRLHAAKSECALWVAWKWLFELGMDRACKTYSGQQCSRIKYFLHSLNTRITGLGYPELCHNQLDCFCFVLNLVGVEQNGLLFCA